METAIGRPTMIPHEIGKEFKTFRVSGKKGMEMPDHISTKEAVVMIKKGKALLKIDGEEQELNEGELHIIPAGKPHSLLLLEDFEAYALMQKVSEIEFI